MSVFIASIEISDQSSSIIPNLRSVGEVFQLTCDTFLIASPLKSTEIRDYIMTTIHPHRAFVTKVAHGAAWNNAICSSSDIKHLYCNI